MSDTDMNSTNPQRYQTFTTEQLEQMPVILTAHQYQALDEALHLIESRAIDPDDPDSTDFSNDPFLEQVYIRLAIAAVAPWDNPVNKPVLSRVGMCFSDVIRKQLDELDRLEQPGAGAKLLEGLKRQAKGGHNA